MLEEPIWEQPQSPNLGSWETLLVLQWPPCLHPDSSAELTTLYAAHLLDEFTFAMRYCPRTQKMDSRTLLGLCSQLSAIPERAWTLVHVVLTQCAFASAGILTEQT